MIQRCDDPHTNGYENYGGRGIRICERWRTYENFVADLGERPARMTLERLDSDRDYEPDNCRWASMREQQNNKRNTRYLMIDGTRHTYADAARHYGINVNVLAYRLSAGWPLLNALTQPLREDRRRPPGAASAPSV